MEKTYLFIAIIILLISFSYVLLMIFFCYGWVHTKNEKLDLTGVVKISVIVAARNEAENILLCLQSIVHQSYLKRHYEVIVVDDASTDSTNSIIVSFCKEYDFIKLITLNEETKNTGKKLAIEKAIEIATGDLIVTVDADCTMNKNWLSTIAAYYCKTNAEMIVGPVCFYDEHTLFEKMQSLEFMALIASGAGALYFNKAIMSNGANLIYTKKVFNLVNGFKGTENIASGDDVLLMYKIKEEYSSSIHFLKYKDAIVYTKAKATFSGFVNQRKRWASKGFRNFNKETKAVSLVVYLFNFLIVLLPFVDLILAGDSYFSLSFFEIALILLLIKCVIDFLLLFLAASFFKKKSFLIYFIPEQLIYLLYVLSISLLSIAGTYEWKGRKIKN
jgi:cellulose synthase/poly-beta-1,6-N-acetylglucosamine synthase-like glycosyltransferase